jgi:hypothetical protein
VDKIWPDKTESEKNKFALLSQELTQGFQLALKQIETNIEEAKSEKWWKAGWRPFVGWVCGSAFAWTYVIGPFFSWIAALIGHPTSLPALNIEELTTLLFGLLGIGTLRTIDKKIAPNGK